METEDTTGQGLATGESTEAEHPPLDLAQDPQPPVEYTPTREEAREMFRTTVGLWSVLTTEGTITRDEC